MLSSDVVSNPVRSIVISFHPDWFRYFRCFLFDIFVTILTFISATLEFVLVTFGGFFAMNPKV